jgi:hypothetical protein
LFLNKLIGGFMTHRGLRSLRKHAKTPRKVRKAQQVLRHPRLFGKGTKARARAIIRAFNKKAAAKGRRTGQVRIKAVHPKILRVPKGRSV